MSSRDNEQEMQPGPSCEENIDNNENDLASELNICSDNGTDANTGIEQDSNDTAQNIESVQLGASGSNPNSSEVNKNYLKNFNPNSLPFPELLKIHENRFLSGFEFGEATKRQARENMRYSWLKCETELKKTEKTCDKHPVTPFPERDHKTPHSQKRSNSDDSSELNTNSDTEFSPVSRHVPQILLKHSDCVEVWNFMVNKEEAANKLRNPRVFLDFKSVTPRMRAILLDWLMEVAEVYHLRRVTYYLSVDYFDRFLSIRPDIPKSMLQLVGVTCLYIAAKLEEIYPPSLAEFSYVCDGACKAQEIVSCEILLLNSLGWEVTITTPSDWLNLYMQLYTKAGDLIKSKLYLNRDFVYPKYSAYNFIKASHLMDLLSLDPAFLSYSYSVIAASAMHYTFGRRAALSVSGLTWQQLKPCVKYMSMFYNILSEAPDPRLQSCVTDPSMDEATREAKNWNSSEQYTLQTHVATMDYFERVTIIRLANMTGLIDKKKIEEGNKLDDKRIDEEARQLMEDLEELNNDDYDDDSKQLQFDPEQPSTSTGARGNADNFSIEEFFNIIMAEEELTDD